MNAGGAWTWGLTRESNNVDTFNLIDVELVDFLKQVMAKIDELSQPNTDFGPGTIIYFVFEIAQECFQTKKNS